MDPRTASILRAAQRQQAAGQLSKTATATKAIAEFKAHCIGLARAANKAGKPIGLLNDFERLGVMFSANAPVEYDGHRFSYRAEFSDVNADGVVDGLYHVTVPHGPPVFDGSPFTPPPTP